jgi:hypothetical protein
MLNVILLIIIILNVFLQIADMRTPLSWVFLLSAIGRKDTQHNDNQYNDTKRNDIQHNNK